MSPFADTLDICVFKRLPLDPIQTEKLAVSRQTEGSVIVYFGIFSQLLKIITQRQFQTLPEDWCFVGCNKSHKKKRTEAERRKLRH